MSATGQGSGATGTGGDAAKVPSPIAAGPEMKALGRFYRDVTWKGVIREGGMGPGTPAMTGAGRGTTRPIQDGRWIVLDCEQDQFLEDGTFVLKWQLHWVSGWAPDAAVEIPASAAEILKGPIGLRAVCGMTRRYGRQPGRQYGHPVPCRIG